MPRMLHSVPRFILAAAAAAMLLAACTQTAVRPAPDRDPAETALQLEAAGDHEGAAAEYLRLAKSWPDRAVHYRLLAAEAQLAAGREAEARATLEAAGAPGSPADRLHARIVEARLALLEGRAEVALELLGDAPQETAPPLLKARRLDVRASAFEQQGAFARAATERIRGLAFIGAGSPEDLERIWSDLNRADAGRLEALRETGEPGIASWVELALLARQLAPTPEALSQALESWMDEYPSHPAIPVITGRILERSERFASRPDRIALLLPLTGEYRQVANAIRDGFLAAWYESADYQPVVTVYDASALNVVAQYRRAVEEGAKLVVGPLEKAAIEELVRAGDLSVPTLALNTLDAPPSLAGAAEEPVLMQFGLPPEEEARAAAQRAWFDGHVRALVIGPANAWGRRLMQTFRAEWEQLGGIVLEEVAYEPALNDFAETVAELLNIDSSAQRARALRERLGRRLEYGTRLRQDADVIFMAALPVAARQILPQLRFYSADHLPVYSSSHAFSGNAGAGLETDLDGLRFPDMPWVLSPGSGVERAVERNWSVRTSALRRLYAFGADAYLIIPHLARLSLQPGSSFRGQTGELTMGPDGTIRRRLPWARIVNGAPQLLDPMPGS